MTMKDSWLDAVPYGGVRKGGTTWGAPQKQQVGAYPSPYDEGTTTFILLGGLVLITGGGAALGWFLGQTKVAALVGGLAGLSYASANLAINASAMAAELNQPKAPQQIPSGPPGPPNGQVPGGPIQSSQLPPGVHTGYPTQGYPNGAGQ